MRTDEQIAIANRYELQGLIETYGPVAIYHAYDTQLSRPVTVQMLLPEGAADPAVSRAFLRHQQIASSIHTCPLLAVYDAGPWHGRPYSVMERDKGRLPTTLYRQGYPPNAALVLGITRQVAASLQCCRDAGLSDWTFSPDAVRVLDDGSACLAIFEGLSGEGGSSNASTDAGALNALMRLMLSGRTDGGESDLRVALVPAFLVSLVERLDPRNGGAVLTAGEVAREIASAEAVALQPTQAYVPGAAIDQSPEGSTLVLAPIVAPHEAPTLAVQAIAAMPAHALTVTTTSGHEGAQDPVVPYTPPEGVPAPPTSKRSPGRVVVFGLVLLALALLTLGGLSLVRGRSLETGAASAAAPALSQPDATAPTLLAAPDLRGKSFLDAQQVANAAGLNLAAVEPVYDGAYTIDTIARQVPDAGVQIAAGGLLTVSLSLGPEPKPTEPVEAAPPQEEQPTVVPVPPAPDGQAGPPAQEKKGGKKDNGKKEEKNKDKEDDDD